MAIGDDIIPWVQIQAAIRQWVVDSTGIPAAQVLWSDQDHPEAVRPFATLRLPAGGPSGLATQAELRPRALVHTWAITVAVAADQTYTLTIDGVGYPYAAVGKTRDEIRDELVLAAAGAPDVTVSALAGTGELQVAADVAGTFHPVLVSPDPDLLAAETQLERGVETFTPDELEVSVQISSRYDDADPSVLDHARVLLGRAKAAFWAPPVTAALRAAGCPPLRTGVVQDLTALLGSQTETRANLDVTLSVAAGIIAETGQIETVETSGTYS